MKTLLIVYHSLTGGTRQMAEAAAGSGRRSGVRRCCTSASGCGGGASRCARRRWLYLRRAREPRRACGTDEGFFRPLLLSGPWPDQRAALRPFDMRWQRWRDAARQTARIATGWRLRAVAEPLIVCTHAQTPEAILAPKVIAANDLDRCRTLGAMLSAGLAMGVF